MACVVDAAEGMGDCFHLHCQAGGWDRIGCTVFMDGSHILLDSEAPPSLVFGDWAISVHTLWGLAVCCFLKWEAWSLTLFCLLAILDSAFPGFLAGVSRRDAGIGLGTFPSPWFAWGRSAGILAVLSPLLDPSKTCPVPTCIPLCLSWLRRHWSILWPGPLSVWFALAGGVAWTLWSHVGLSTALKYALTCSTFCPVCIDGRSSMNLMVSWVCPWWFPVWLSLPLLSFSRFLCAIVVRPSP